MPTNVNGTYKAILCGTNSSVILHTKKELLKHNMSTYLDGDCGLNYQIGKNNSRRTKVPSETREVRAYVKC